MYICIVKGKQNQETMKIPNQVYLEWKLLYSHGDSKAIADSTGYHRHTISKALFKGEATTKVMRKINSFYADKKKDRERGVNNLVRELMEQLQTA